MTNHRDRRQNPSSHLDLNQFWSSHLGLTLVTISLAVIVFVVTPLREAGLPSRLFFDIVAVTLMISGTLVIDQSRMAKAFAIAVVLGSATVLGTGRLHPTPFLRLLGSAFVIVTLLLYVRIVLLVMFYKGPLTWGRIQGGVGGRLRVFADWDGLGVGLSAP